MATLLPTRVVTYADLCAKGLINDLKQAATCDVRTVCRLSCINCPYVIENIDTKKITIEGLSSYSLELKKGQEGQLLIFISAPDIDNWLIKHNLSCKELVT